MLEALRLLHAQSEITPAYCGSYYVRHLDADEPLSQFGHGIPESPLLQRDWIWIAYNKADGEPLAALIAAPVQGMALLSRIYAKESAPKSVLVGLFRKSLADIRKRGYARYAVFLDGKRSDEAGLISIARKAGATQFGGEHIMLSGPTDIKY